MVDEEGEKTGEIKFQTELVWIAIPEEEDVVEIEPPVEILPAVPHPELNGKSLLRITIEEATLEKTNDNTNNFI